MQKLQNPLFTAKSCNFQGIPGYMVEQWHDGAVVCSQFVASSAYREFCDAIGTIPIIQD